MARASLAVGPRRWLRGLLLASLAGLATPAVAAEPGVLTVAVPAEPESLIPRNGCSYASQFVMDNVYERLTRRQPDGTIVGWLADSFEQTDPLTWRFHLKQGVTFSNGEPFTADAIVTLVDYFLDPNIPSRCIGDFVTLAGAVKIDDHTVDVKTSKPDPILPISFGRRFFIVAPQWLTGASDDEAAVTVVGTGPYMLTDWTKGISLTLERNPTYWGETPTIETIRLLPRVEGQVRADMVRTGEADIAINLTNDAAASMPKSVVEPTTESILVRLNTQNPVLADINVRKALALSVDTATIIDALFPGTSSALNGQVARQTALGYNPDLTDYPYDPAQAAQLIEAAGAAGQELSFTIRTDLLPNVGELAEALQAMMEQSGLKISLVNLDAAPWRDALYARKEGQERTELFISGASNIQFDSSRLINNYFGLGQFSHADSEEFQAKMDEVGAMSGDERIAGYRALWQEIHDNYWVIPLFGIDFVHGVSERVDWQPRDDGYFDFLSTAKLVD